MKTRRLVGTLVVGGLMAVSQPALAHHHHRSSARVESFSSPTAMVPGARGGGPNGGSTVAGSMVPSGTVIRGQLLTTIGTKESHPGDPFVANVRTPLYDSQDRAILPTGSQLVGHVTRAHRGGTFGHATIGLAVDGLNVYGTFVPVNGRVTGYSSLATRRTGLLRHQRAWLPAGSDINVQIQQPIATRELSMAAHTEPQTVHVFHPVVVYGGGPQAQPAPVHRARPRHVARPAHPPVCPAGCVAPNRTTP